MQDNQRRLSPKVRHNKIESMKYKVLNKKSIFFYIGYYEFLYWIL